MLFCVLFQRGAEGVVTLTSPPPLSNSVGGYYDLPKGLPRRDEVVVGHANSGAGVDMEPQISGRGSGSMLYAAPLTVDLLDANSHIQDTL